MKNNNDLDSIRLLKAVVKLKTICSRRGRCYGCMFHKWKITKTGRNGICELNDNPPFKWDLNDLEKWLSEHK